MIKTSKQCRDCEEVKYLSEFYSQNKYSKSKGEYTYYHPTCKKCYTQSALRWREENYERWSENNKEYSLHYMRKRDKDLKRESQRKYVTSGKQREWQRNNTGKIKEYQVSRQHKLHEISQKEWLACKKFFNDSCAYCGVSYEDHKRKYNEDLHKDHVDHDGTNDLSNCVPACKFCNSSKGDFNMEDWYVNKSDSYEEMRLKKIQKWLNSEYKIYLK